MIEFTVLGPLTVHRDGREIALPAPMLRRLLAVLLSRVGRPVPVTHILDALWDGRPPRSARKTMQVYVHRLRRELGDEQRLMHDALGYALCAHNGELDSLRFAHLAEQGRLARRSGDLERASSLFRQGLSLWRGPAFHGVRDGDPVAAEADYLDQQRIQVYEESVEVELDLGRHGELAAELAVLVRSHPYRERLRAQSMLALYRSGRRAEALEMFRDTRMLLRDQLGIEPGETLRRLHEAMLRDDGLLAPGHGPAPWLPEPEPEPDREGEGEGNAGTEARAQPPSRTSSHPQRTADRGAMPPARGRWRAGGLPAEVTSFVGRRSELADVAKLLRESRLVTVTGVGGVGKTRLAVRLAHEVQSEYPDGVRLVDLSLVHDPDLVAHTVAQALDLHDQTLGSPVQLLREHLAVKRLLLVLDTCEHVVDACALLAETILSSAPAVRVLATSRESLGITGEQIFVLPPLPVPRPGHAASPTTQHDGVTLFVERARAADRNFTVGPHNREAVSQLCILLDGIPLARELASVRLRSMSVQQILERLDDRFALLGSGRRTALPRHQTLRTAVEWSHQLCSPEERLLWARLSVFSGSFDLEAVESVCCDGKVPRETVTELLLGLVDKSILLREEDSWGVRLRILDTMREYGAERLHRRGEQERLRLRHRDHYAELAHRIEDDWFGPRQPAWRQRAMHEHANIRSALEFCLARPEEHLTGLDLAASLWWFWTACGLLMEGRHYLDRLLGLSAEPSQERVKALWACGHVAMGQGDVDAVDRGATECRDLAAQRDDPVALAFVGQLLGTAAALRGDLDRAVSHTADGVRRQRAVAHGHGGLAMSLVGHGFVLLLRGELDAAVTALEEQRTLCEARGEVWTRAWGDSIRSSLDLARGDIDSAVMYARASLKVKHQLGDTLGIAMGVDTLAQAALASGDADRAARLLAVSREIWQTSGPSQFGSPELRAARDRCEQQARKHIGDRAYEAAFDEGAELGLDEALRLALGEQSSRTVAQVLGQRSVGKGLCEAGR
ncbi:AfsR/SARP family transcriptional regulator [Streptomyces sp. NPDC001970]